MIKQRKLFNEYSIYCFKISSILFGLYILFLILSFMFEYSFFIEHKLELTVYLFFTFPDCQDVINALFLPRSFGLTQKNQKVKATLRRLQISFAPLKSRITRASRSDSRDFFTLRSQFALRLLR